MLIGFDLIRICSSQLLAKFDFSYATKLRLHSSNKCLFPAWVIDMKKNP